MLTNYPSPVLGVSARCITFLKNVNTPRRSPWVAVSNQGMHRTTIFRILQSANARKLICANACPSTGRQLGTTTARKTDGVYKALTAMRVRIPWIEALTKQRAQENRQATQSIAPPESSSRDLLPKKMSDSFHKVVCTSMG